MTENPSPSSRNAPFFVHLVESPSPSDLLDGRTEGQVLKESLRLAGTPVVYSLATNLATFTEALNDRLYDAIARHGCVPVVHLSMQGGPTGLQLTDGSVLAYEELREEFQHLNHRLQGTLLLCLPSCHSTGGWRMAFGGGDLPYYGILAHNGAVRWDDAAVAYVTFYHLLATRHMEPAACVDAMCKSSGDDNFHFADGSGLRDAWYEAIVGSLDGIIAHTPAQGPAQPDRSGLPDSLE